MQQIPAGAYLLPRTRQKPSMLCLYAAASIISKLGAPEAQAMVHCPPVQVGVPLADEHANFESRLLQPPQLATVFSWVLQPFAAASSQSAQPEERQVAAGKGRVSGPADHTPGHAPAV